MTMQHLYRRILALLFSVSVAYAAPAWAGTYVIKKISVQDPGIGWILVGLQWQEGTPRIAVELTVNENTSDANEFVRAYFFDANKNLLQTYSSAASVGRKTADGVIPFSLAGHFRKGETEMVYFPIIPEIKDQWKSVVVVFGNPSTASAAVYPEGKLEDFDFKEKTLVQRSAAGGESGTS